MPPRWPPIGRLGNTQIGLVVNLVPIHAASESDADRQAANRLDAYFNRQFLDPVLLGRVPTSCLKCSALPGQHWTTDELRQIRQPIDFVGVNYYLRLVVRDDPSAGPARARAVRQPNCPHTAMEWEIYPQGLTDILQWVQRPLRRCAALHHGKWRGVRRRYRSQMAPSMTPSVYNI